MINNAAFLSIKNQLELITDDQVKTCTIPISIYLQESEHLHSRATKDLEQLRICGISLETLKDLKTRIEACRFVYTQWKLLSKEKGCYQQKWEELSPQAFELRKHLIHTFLYAFRNRPSSLSVLKDIKKQHSQSTQIQSLKDLSVLGLKHFNLLEPLSMKKETLIKAAELASQLTELLANYHAEQGSSNSTKVQYLKSFSYTKELVDEIRLAGKFVFWKDKTHLKEYASAYVRNKNKKYIREKDQSN